MLVVPPLMVITFAIQVAIAEFIPIEKQTLKTALFLTLTFIQGIYMKVMFASMSRLVFYLSLTEIKSAYSADGIASALSATIVLIISYWPAEPRIVVLINLIVVAVAYSGIWFVNWRFFQNYDKEHEIIEFIKSGKNVENKNSSQGACNKPLSERFTQKMVHFDILDEDIPEQIANFVKEEEEEYMRNSQVYIEELVDKQHPVLERVKSTQFVTKNENLIENHFESTMKSSLSEVL